jgi:formate/nitrite transporter FocA (FNT family)
MARVSEKVATLQNLTWGNFFANNLVPVTLGNIIGGAVFVAAIYWSIFLRNKDA